MIFRNRFNVLGEEENEFLNLIASRPFAWADIRGGNGYERITGKVSFYNVRNGVVVFANIKNLPVENDVCASNIFAMHIHSGNCTGNGEDDFFNVGEHFNPNNCPHPQHKGDLMPLFAGKNGTATYVYWTDRFTLNEVIGKSVVIHLETDDFESQPSGGVKTKIACGKIRSLS